MNLRWWQRPFTFVYGDGTVKEVDLKPIRNMTLDLRTQKGRFDYAGIEERLENARRWLAQKVVQK